MKYKLLCLIAGLLILGSAFVLGHDISDREVQGITNSIQLSVWQDLIFVDYWIAVGKMESANYLPLIDADKDGEITDDEKLAYLEEIRKRVTNTAFSLSIDGQSNIPLKQWKPGTIVIDESKDAPVPIKIGVEFVLDFASPQTVPLIGAGFPITRSEEHNLTFFAGNVMDKQTLTKIYVNQDEWIDINWTPEDYRHCLGLSTGIYLKPFESTWAKFTFTILDKPVGNSSPFSFTQTPVNKSGQQDSKLEGLLSGELSLLIIIGALAAAFGYGAWHALTPGHGKTLVAAYLIGSRGTIAQALLLGLIVTFTHTFIVVVAGLIAWGASSYIHQAALSTYLGVISGLIIVVMGLWIFISRAFGTGHLHHHHDHSEDHHNHNHDHPEGHHNHPSEILRTSEHAEHSHSHGTPLPVTGEKVKLRHIIGLGISGGMVPCAGAVLIMTMAISLNKALWGLALIGAFSLGLASVLIIIGILIVTGSSFLNRFLVGEKVFRILSIIGPLVITLIGFAIIFKVFIDSGVIILNLQALP